MEYSSLQNGRSKVENFQTKLFFPRRPMQSNLTDTKYPIFTTKQDTYYSMYFTWLGVAQTSIQLKDIRFMAERNESGHQVMYFIKFKKLFAQIK